MKTRDDVDQVIARYLIQVNQALGSISGVRRRQIIAEISEHISEGRGALEQEDEAGVRALLGRIGSPEMIAREAAALQPPRRRSDPWVPCLLLLGGIAFVVGWFVGVAMLWKSPTWNVRDKLIGTFVLPGGILAALFLLTRTESVTGCTRMKSPGLSPVSHCVTSGFSFSPPVGGTFLLVALVAPILCALYLDRRRRHVCSGPTNDAT
jgi:hypothetical protein